MIHNSLWEVNVLLESAILGWTWEALEGRTDSPYMCGKDHLTRVLSWDRPERALRCIKNPRGEGGTHR